MKQIWKIGSSYEKQRPDEVMACSSQFLLMFVQLDCYPTFSTKSTSHLFWEVEWMNDENLDNGTPSYFLGNTEQFKQWTAMTHPNLKMSVLLILESKLYVNISHAKAWVLVDVKLLIWKDIHFDSHNSKHFWNSFFNFL